MRTNFFISIFLLISALSFGQGAPKKPGKEANGKLAQPDVSVLYDTPKGKAATSKEKPSDTLNIIPPETYSRLSFGANFGMAFFACTQSNYPDHCLYFQWSAVTKKRRTFPKKFHAPSFGNPLISISHHRQHLS